MKIYNTGSDKFLGSLIRNLESKFENSSVDLKFKKLIISPNFKIQNGRFKILIKNFY